MREGRGAEDDRERREVKMKGVGENEREGRRDAGDKRKGREIERVEGKMRGEGTVGGEGGKGVLKDY